MNKIRLYLKHAIYPIEIVSYGTDEIGFWKIEIKFEEEYVQVKRDYTKAEVILYTIPKANLCYIDWGNDKNE